MKVILYLRTPALSPDGSLIAFSYAGDIWVVESSGGEASSITSRGGYDESRQIDGAKGRSEVWRMSGRK